MKELMINVVSDVVCPWCFIGKRRLEAAIHAFRQEAPEVVPRIRWLPFFLNPDTPEEGEPYRAHLERKFGGTEKLAQIWAQITEAGRADGIEFAFERIEKRSNTLKAHRLIHHVQQSGDAGVLVDRLFAGQFIEGKDVGDVVVLARLAAECGFDESATLAYLRSDTDAAEVRALFVQSQQQGITSVPFFILDGRFGVGGAQAPELMLTALRRCLVS